MSAKPYNPPKYFQISHAISGKIQRGELALGAPVPSENEIIRQYHVSNTTARKALHELEKQSWVTRVKGRGTFVRNYTVLRAINRISPLAPKALELNRAALMDPAMARDLQSWIDRVP